jgi:hypothetical protein
MENLALRHQLVVLNPFDGQTPQGQGPCPSQLRPSFLGNPQRNLVALGKGVGDRPTSNRRTLASGGIPSLLALAIASSTGSNPKGP